MSGIYAGQRCIVYCTVQKIIFWAVGVKFRIILVLGVICLKIYNSCSTTKIVMDLHSFLSFIALSNAYPGTILHSLPFIYPVRSVGYSMIFSHFLAFITPCEGHI